MAQDNPVTPEDMVVERALERLESGWDPQGSAVADSGDTEIREQLEAMAMLAYGLEPQAPAADVKQSLMEQIRGGRVEAADSARRRPEDMTLQHATVPSDGPVETIREDYDAADKTLMMGVPAEVVSMRPTPVRSGFSTTTWALAAALAFCLVGLGYLYGQVNAKNVVIAMQQERLESSREMESDMEKAQADLRRLTDNLMMVTRVAQTAYPLRPSITTVGAPGTGRPPAGKVFVCGQHQRWYLSMTDLETPPDGYEYHLWFLTQEGAVDAGSFEVTAGAAGMQDLTMPDGTEGFQITLEPIGGGEAPSGKTIMIGDRPVSL